MPSREVDLETIKVWRELGYFYDFDKSSNSWVLCGSKNGILRLATFIKEYTEKPASNTKGEHEHLGPYMYLKIMTWDFPEITEDCWAGTLEDLRRLSAIIEDNILTKKLTSFTIANDYSNRSKIPILIQLEADDFDPSTADVLIQHRQ